MSDPLSVASGVAGLVSLGMQIAQGLIDFYSSYKSQDVAIDRTIHKLENLSAILQCLDQALAKRKFVDSELTVIDKIESSIAKCGEPLHELQEECEKFTKPGTKGIRNAVQSTARRLAYPFRESTFQRLDEDITEILGNLSLALDVLQLQGSAQIQNDVEEIKALLGLVRTSQISESVRDWLKAPDATLNYNDACAKRNPASGLWLVNSPTFTTWLEKDNSFLWLNGFAGCGKSVLSSTAIQYAFRHRQSNTRIGLAFFYFAFNDGSKQDASAMLRAVLLQLSNQLGDGHTILTHMKNQYRDGVPPVPALVESLRQLVRSFQDVYIVVDALDESPRGQAREAVLDVVEDLRRWSLRALHVLVTSRDEPDIRERLAPSHDEDISLKNTGVDEDIAAFVSRKLKESRSLQKWLPYHSRIKEALTVRANGVFRWVDCQLASIASCPHSEYRLEVTLSSLPASLDATYERMLRNIDESCTDDAKRILTLLCFSKRPMTVQEVIDGLAVELGQSSRLNLKRRIQDEHDISQICPGFIDISVSENNTSTSDETAHIVRIAHYSVQEYLESDRIRQQSMRVYSMKSAACNVEIAQICLVYLMDPMLSSETLTGDTLKTFPLADYAARFWYEHYRDGEQALSSAPQVDLFARELFENRGDAFETWIRIWDPDRSWGEGRYFDMNTEDICTPAYYASLLGLHRLLRGLPEMTKGERLQKVVFLKVPSLLEPHLINAQGGYYGNALQAASANNHEITVEILLGKGAEVNAEGGYYGTALEAASFEGNKEIVELLLSKGAEPNDQGGEYGNALQAASFNGHETIVELLLSKGADVDAHGGKCGSALQAASISGHETTVKLLLRQGAEVNGKGGDYGNALQAASVGSNKTVVELLLSKGSEVNAAGGEFGNALQGAAVAGSTTIAELLLANGANINAQGGKYGTALQAASACGYETMVGLLLSRGAEVNAQSGLDGVALQAASDQGHMTIVESLLSQKGPKSIIEILLSFSAESNTEGGYYGNALQAACRQGYQPIVELLLSKGADVNLEGGEYGSALQAASTFGHKTIVGLLLSKGANVNARGGFYGNALRAASARGYETIFQLLLSKGADPGDEAQGRGGVDKITGDGDGCSSDKEEAAVITRKQR